MQVLAEGAAAAHTKAAVAADGTVMLSSRRAAAGTLGPPGIHTEPCSASAPPWLGAINAKPSALLLAQGGGQSSRLRASPATPAGQPQMAAGTLQATAGLKQHCW